MLDGPDDDTGTSYYVPSTDEGPGDPGIDTDDPHSDDTGDDPGVISLGKSISAIRY